MPAIQRGSVYKLGPKRYGIRWRDRDRKLRRKSPFTSPSAAREYYRTVVEPELRGDPVPVLDMTLAEFVKVFLERHAPNVRPRTIDALRWRLGVATEAYGDAPLRDLEKMTGELASWKAKLPERSRFAIMAALRQALAAAVRWGHMTTNPAVLSGQNRQPPPKPVRAYTRAELDAIAAELDPAYRQLPIFAAATGLRPEEWQALERRDIDRREGVLHVRRTVSSGEVVDLGKTAGSRRQVPLSQRALDAVQAMPPRLDTPLMFPAPEGGTLNLDNFRRREWAPAVEASGVRKPATIYDLRKTFASDALAAGVPVFTLARIMGTSVRMIERHYGALLDGAGPGIVEALDALDAERDRGREERR
jgi:integrase